MIMMGSIKQILFEYRKRKYEESINRHNQVVDNLRKSHVTITDRKEPFRRFVRRMMM